MWPDNTSPPAMTGEAGGGTRSTGTSGQLIFPLVAKPNPRPAWAGRALVAGAITAILVAAVSVAVHQARPATTGGKWLIAAATPEPAPRVDASNRQQVSVFELQPGTCLSDIDVPADVQMVPVVPCYTEHQAEVIATLRMPGGPWPGRAVVDEFAVAECVPAVLRVRTEVRDDLQWTYFGPTENSWTVRADRTVSCLIVSRGAPLDGPVVTGRAAL